MLNSYLDSFGWRLPVEVLIRDQAMFSNLKNVQPRFRRKLLDKINSYPIFSSYGKYKNFCFFQGKGRTYNRSLFVSRHTLRKLAGIGLISGLTSR